jgi:hypothetical protein
MRHISLGAASVVAGALLLAGCGWIGGKETKLVCPASFIAPDTDKVAVFRAGGSTFNDVSYGVQITDVQSRCDRADHGLAVDTKVAFHLVSNDRALRAGSFQYFVSVVDGNQNILTKKTYIVPFEFDARLRDMNKQDELVENLPLRDTGTGGNYAIVVGLQLTEAQLQFNRSAAHAPSISVAPTVSVALPPQQKNSASTP